LAAVIYELFEEGLLCRVGEDGRVGSICEAHLGYIYEKLELWLWVLVG
jgi:hypothetical protein